jgi:hypothetical protein
MSGKGKGRKRDDFTKMPNPFPPKKKLTGADGGKAVTKKEFQDLVEWLRAYCNNMERWGQDMRDDLIRLEGQAGFPSGDPGDPPGGPPNGDE